MTSSVIGLEKKFQSTFQSRSCTKKKKKKKITVTVWWTTAHLILYSFLNPGKTVTSKKYIQQIDGMHRKLELPLVNSMGPILLYNNA